ncbi:peptidase C14, caspase domain-containing protein [Gongronella butleri]|nr:peptidase C14, caspase domain-containing protein [Gongronella butleri]
MLGLGKKQNGKKQAEEEHHEEDVDEQVDEEEIEEGEEEEEADVEDDEEAEDEEESEGRSRALLVGLCYTGMEGNELHGCFQDVHNMKNFLMDCCDYKEEEITVITDEERKPLYPEVMEAMAKLVEGNQPGDRFFFHYSGHGGTIPDEDGDEVDGFDETICLIGQNEEEDDKSYFIANLSDDWINANMVLPLKAGTHMTCVFDSCHSGSVMDLPYTYSTKGKVKKTSVVRSMSLGFLDAGRSMIGERGTARGGLKTIVDSASTALKKQDIEEKNRKTKGGAGTVVMFSGAKDSQYSTDANIEGQRQGALSWSWISSLEENPDRSYKDLLNSIREKLEGKYDQLPQLSTSHEIDLNDDFIL